jgi:hypothetical protein
VNCNGTGTFIRVIKSNGVTANTVDDFIITAATRSLGGYGNQMIATTLTPRKPPRLSSRAASL